MRGNFAVTDASKFSAASLVCSQLYKTKILYVYAHHHSIKFVLKGKYNNKEKKLQFYLIPLRSALKHDNFSGLPFVHPRGEMYTRSFDGGKTC